MLRFHITFAHPSAPVGLNHTAFLCHQGLQLASSAKRPPHHISRRRETERWNSFGAGNIQLFFMMDEITLFTLPHSSSSQKMLLFCQYLFCFSNPHSTQFRPNDGSVPLFSASELAPTYHDGGINHVLGCPHYARSCKPPLLWLENVFFHCPNSSPVIYPFQCRQTSSSNIGTALHMSSLLRSNSWDGHQR